MEPLIALNGQNTKLNSFPVSNPDGYNCRIQVLEEPHYSRAGQVYPKLFDCEFDPGSIWYEHNGGKLLKNDMVKMRVFLLAANHTIEQGIKFQKSQKWRDSDFIPKIFKIFEFSNFDGLMLLSSFLTLIFDA